MAKLKLASMINPEGCSEGELRDNLGRLQHILENVFDHVFDIEYSSDNTTLTINLQNINQVDATTINADTYQDGSETELCIDYCPTAIASRSQGGSQYDWWARWEKDRKRHEDRLRRVKELKQRIYVWDSREFDGPLPVDVGI